MGSSKNKTASFPPQRASLRHLTNEPIQYNQTIKWLAAARKKAEDKNDAGRMMLLAAASQICSLCSQLQDEASYHEQTYQRAVTRKIELDRQLQQLLTVLQRPSSETELSQTTLLQEKNTEASPGFWQRLQTFVKHSFGRESKDPEPLPGLHEAADEPDAGPEPAEPGELAEKQGAVTTQTIEDTELSPATASPPDQFEEPEAVRHLPEDEALAESTETAVPHLVVYFLGPFRLFQDDQPLNDWNGSKGKMIFKYMVVNRDQPIAKDILMEIFWPESDPDAARNNLNVAIYGLRQTLRNGYHEFSHILFQDNAYQFNPELQIWTDFETFANHVQAAKKFDQDGKHELAIREYHAAEVLYQGEFLAEDRYDEWPVPIRHSLQNKFLDVLVQLRSYYFVQEDYAACVNFCHKILAVEPCHESTHRRLMRCYSRQNQHYLGIRQFHHCVEVLKSDLDVVPAPQTTRLYEQIRNHQPV